MDPFRAGETGFLVTLINPGQGIGVVWISFESGIQ
jgi:hypothetical protein